MGCSASIDSCEEPSVNAEQLHQDASSADPPVAKADIDATLLHNSYSLLDDSKEPLFPPVSPQELDERSVAVGGDGTLEVPAPSTSQRPAHEAEDALPEGERRQVQAVLAVRMRNRQCTLSTNQNSMDHYHLVTFGISDDDDYFKRHPNPSVEEAATEARFDLSTLNVSTNPATAGDQQCDLLSPKRRSSATRLDNSIAFNNGVRSRSSIKEFSSRCLAEAMSNDNTKPNSPNPTSSDGGHAVAGLVSPAGDSRENSGRWVTSPRSSISDAKVLLRRVSFDNLSPTVMSDGLPPRPLQGMLAKVKGGAKASQNAECSVAV